MQTKYFIKYLVYIIEDRAIFSFDTLVQKYKRVSLYNTENVSI